MLPDVSKVPAVACVDVCVGLEGREDRGWGEWEEERRVVVKERDKKK